MLAGAKARPSKSFRQAITWDRATFRNSSGSSIPQKATDPEGRPEVTHGILRIMKKLEAGWNGSPDDEYGAPIDVASGRIGLLTGDKLETHPFRFLRHPVTGQRASGRVLSQWPAIRETACRVHAALPHRVVIGWDIALTPEGPVILEGNNNFDVMFFQRVYRQPVGATRLGELIQHHIGRLRAKHAKP